MTAPQKSTAGKSSFPFWPAALIVIGGVGLYLGQHNFILRVAGILAIVASVYLLRNSRLSKSIAASESSSEGIQSNSFSRPGRVLWGLSIFMALALGASWLLLQLDAEHGGHDAWPAGLFAGVGVVGACVWGVLVARLRLSSQNSKKLQ